MAETLKRVFIVFKTHFDIGFTHLARELPALYGGQMADDVLGVCRDTRGEEPGRRYVWTLPAWPLRLTMAQLDAGRRAEAEKFIREGQLAWHALPFTTHTEVWGMEDFLRGLYIGREMEERYGKRVHSAKMTDVPGHCWNLPSLLRKSGVRFLHLGSNPSATPPDVPKLFWWEGPDGARLLTYYAKGGYGSGLVPPRDWEHPFWLAMLHTGDNLGPQSAEYVAGLFETARRELPGVEVIIGTLDDFADAVLASGCELPVVRGDLADTWIRGVGAAPTGVARMRALRSELQEAEAQHTLLALAGQGTAGQPVKALAARAYEKLLLFAEHTWSLDTKVSILPPRRHGDPWVGYQFWADGGYDPALFETLRATHPDYRRLEESWQEQLDYLADAEADIRALQGAVQAGSGGTAKTFTAWGTLGFAHRQTVALAEVALNEARPVQLVDATGNASPVYPGPAGIPCADLRLPPLGAATYRLEPAPLRQAGRSIARLVPGGALLENAHLLVEVNNETGCLRSLCHKPTGRQWVDPGSPLGFGEYRYDIYSAEELNRYIKDYLSVVRDWAVNDMGKADYPTAQGHESFVARQFSVSVEGGPGWGRVTLEAALEGSTPYGNGKVLRAELFLKEDAPYIDLRYTIVGKAATPFIESGHFAFPLRAKAEAARYRLNKLGCVLDPARDILPDCNHDLHCAEGWTAVEEGEHGFAILPRDMPLFSYGQPGVLRFSHRPAAPRPTLLMQGFNNAWGTNFPQWIEGDLTFSYRLYPYRGGWREAGVWQLAEAYKARPRLTPVGSTVQLLAEGLDHCRVLALKTAETGEGVILRLQDIGGAPCTKSLHFALPLREAWLCSALEDREERVPVGQGGRVELAFRPFELHTLCLLPF